jgi:hypothetical protein
MDQVRIQHNSFCHYLLASFLTSLALSAPVHALESALELRDVYSRTVDRQLILPEDEQHYYAELLMFQLHKVGLNSLPAQYMLMVDRNPNVQAAMLFWLAENGQLELIGASPASTGKGGGYDYFETPLGIFEHTIKNMDFRAEGTKNKLGLMGYGNKGMRVYDFGWVMARKTWTPEIGEMRLQLHSTDLLRLEPSLGKVQSRGCIRIPATLNKLLDHYGVLDAEYENAINNKKIIQVLDPEREKNPWPGRYMLVVDSRRVTRPDWSPLPIVQKNSNGKLNPEFSPGSDKIN